MKSLCHTSSEGCSDLEARVGYQ